VGRNAQIFPYRSCHKRRQLDTHVGCLLLWQLDVHVGRLLQRPSAPPSQEKGGSRIVVSCLLRVSRHLHESQPCPPCGIGSSPRQATLLWSVNIIAQRQSTPGANAQCRRGLGWIPHSLQCTLSAEHHRLLVSGWGSRLEYLCRPSQEALAFSSRVYSPCVTGPSAQCHDLRHRCTCVL
jgi:hypothetical protein